MELEELKQSWQRQARLLDAHIALDRTLLHAVMHDRAAGALGRLRLWVTVEIVFAAGALVSLGGFSSGADHSVALTATALGLMGCAAAWIVACALQIIAIGAVDYGAPVVELQQRFQRLRVLRIRTTQWILLLGPLLWLPVLAVGLAAVSPIDLYAEAPPAWIIANLAFGVLFVVALRWVAVRFADRLEQTPFIQGLLRDFGGQHIERARLAVRALEDFERTLEAPAS